MGELGGGLGSCFRDEKHGDPFCRMTEECFKKCMDKKFREGELNLGETSCVDRCCHKYWQATAIVGQLLGVHVQKSTGQQ